MGSEWVLASRGASTHSDGALALVQGSQDSDRRPGLAIWTT